MKNLEFYIAVVILIIIFIFFPLLMNCHAGTVGNNIVSDNSIKLAYSITTDESAEKVFNFLVHIDRYYLSLSKGHKKFKIISAGLLAEGVLISDEEAAGGQYIIHNYRVAKIEKNRYIKLISDPSMATMWKIIKKPVKVTVEFEIKPQDNGKVALFSYLTLEFKDKISKSFAVMMNTRNIWHKHLVEEMKNGLKIIESNSGGINL